MIDLLVKKLNTALNQAGFKKYLANTGWMFLVRISSLFVSFAATAIIARQLGPSNYGQLSYAISFTGIFSFLAVLGIDQVLYRDLIKFPQEKNRYLGSALAIRLVASLLAVLICMVFAFVAGNDRLSLLLILILSISFVFNSFQVLGFEFQARVKSKYPSINSLYIVLFLNIAKIVIVLTGKGVVYLALLLLFESVLYAASYLVLFKTELKENIFAFRFDKTIASKLLADSWPMIFVGAFSLVYSRIDQILIKQMMDVSAVGLYDAAVRLSEVWYFIPSLISTSLFPAIVNAKITSDEIYARRLGRLIYLVLVISSVISLPVALLAPTMISVLYGSAFSGGVTVLRIYVWSNVGVALNTVFSSFLVAENMRKALFLSTTLVMVANIVLNLMLIPKYGIAGSAWATAISYTLGPLSILFFCRPRQLIFKALRFVF